MGEPRYKKLSIRGPMILFVVVMVLIVTLTVLWNVVLVQDYQTLRALAVQSGTFHWTFIALGSALFLTIIVLSSILGAQLFSQIRWSQRQSQFIASVSHELNSPLSSIKLFAQTLRSPDLSAEDRRSFVEKILFDVERLSRLISNVLRAAEMDNRGEELLVIPHPVELYAYLADYIEDARALHAENELRISLAGEPEVWVELDRAMFRQVLDNLIDNAVRYSGEGAPEIDLLLEPLSTGVELRVVDQGIGVQPADLPKLFERFYRGEWSGRLRRRKGTGIGLFVVRSIVEAHGGRVRATSDGPGRGTSIRIHLPPLDEEVAA